MSSAPSRFEVEHLHRLVAQASADASGLEERVEVAHDAGGLGPVLAAWAAAAEALEEALARARPALIRDGSPGGQLARIQGRLTSLRRTVRNFSLDDDLDGCAQAWTLAGLELAQLSGRDGEALVRLLGQHKPAIDRATATLSQAREDDGLPQAEQRKLEELRRQRDRAREKHERLFQAYQSAQRDFEAAQRQKSADPAAAAQVRVALPPPPRPAPVKPLHRILSLQAFPAAATQVQRTLSQLATSERRPLVDPRAAELRAHLARLDAILARLQGRAGGDIALEARAVGAILMRMSVLTARAGSAPHVAGFRKLIEERKGQLQRIARAQAPTAFQALIAQGHAPRFSFGSWLKETVSDRVSEVARVAGTLVQQTAAGVEKVFEGQAQAAAEGVQRVARGAQKVYSRLERVVVDGVAGAVGTGVRKGASLLRPAESSPLAAALQQAFAAVGALPALGLAPLAQVGVGALQGGAAALAAGGSLEDVAAGAAGGALDAAAPGAVQSLKSLKGGKPGSVGSPTPALEEIEHLARRRAEPPRPQRRRPDRDPLEEALAAGTRSAPAKPQSSLERATELARRGAELFGEDSELGQLLINAADRAERMHGPVAAQKPEDTRHEETAVHLEGGRPAAEAPRPAEEAAEAAAQRDARLQQAWERIGVVAAKVQKFEVESESAQRAIETLLEAGRANEASLELIGLGSRCDQIDRAIREAKELARTHEPYEKEIVFYEGWQRRTRARVHAAIAEAKGLGAQVAISGSGVQEKTHPDLFANTRAIYAVRTKARSFAGAVQDPEAASQVKKVLGEARQAKGDLQALKAKYREDAGATAFLSGGGIQDKLIDEVLRKLEPAAKEPPSAKPETAQKIEHGLAAIQKLRKQALQAGRRVDAGLEKVERGLSAGMKVGKRVDSGLERVAELAERVSKILGEDSPLGRLAHRVGEGAGHGHEKLEEALGVVARGEEVLGQGRRILHRGLSLLQGQKPQDAVQRALQWVTAFGQEVASAIRDVERMMHGGRTREAERRVRSVQAFGEQTQAEIAGAARAAASDAKLAARVASARKHFLDLRAHFLAFVRGLHGLGEPPARKDGPVRPSIDQLIEQILGGKGGPIHVDRARGGMHGEDLQDLDRAALDTWIGSGQGANLFSDVFGAFLPAEGAVVVHHAHPRQHGHPRPRRKRPHESGGRGFFAKLFERLEGFADRIGGLAKQGSRLLGKGMHYAEMGMHGLSRLEGAAERVQESAAKAERVLDRMGLHGLAGVAGRIGGAAGSVDEEAKVFHGGLEQADAWMGKGKKAARKVEHGAETAAGIFDQASHRRFGKLVNLFRAPADGDGIDGRLSPDRVALGSALDEPRRLDVSTLSRMEWYLGGDFSGVRIHTGPGAGEVTRRFNAEAVTVKDHVFFAPGRFNPSTVEGQRLIAHELTHVLQKGRANLDVRTAEGEALRAEHGYGRAPAMETLDLRRPEPGFRIATDGEGQGPAAGIHTAKRTRSRGHEAGGKDAQPDGEEMLEQISSRVYELLMEELEQAFESR